MKEPEGRLPYIASLMLVRLQDDPARGHMHTLHWLDSHRDEVLSEIHHRGLKVADLLGIPRRQLIDWLKTRNIAYDGRGDP